MLLFYKYDKIWFFKANWIIFETKIYRDIDSLLPHDVKGNCKKAFDAGEALGIPRVIEPADMDILTVPDKLAVMTYLYQLRAHFTGHELEVFQSNSLILMSLSNDSVSSLCLHNAIPSNWQHGVTLLILCYCFNWIILGTPNR